MSQNERPPRADVIEIALTIDVDEEWTFRARDEKRLAAHSAEGASRTIHAAGYDRAGTFKGTITVGMRSHVECCPRERELVVARFPFHLWVIIRCWLQGGYLLAETCSFIPYASGSLA